MESKALALDGPAYAHALDSTRQNWLDNVLRLLLQVREQGHLEERQSVIENLLNLRFGVDETLSLLVKPLRKNHYGY